MSETPKSIIVIGAGIAGVASALFLQRDGHTVTILDPRGVGEGAFRQCRYDCTDILCADGASGHNETGPEDAALDPAGSINIRWSYLAEISPLADRLNPQ